jgi:hypothetical protein
MLLFRQFARNLSTTKLTQKYEIVAPTNVSFKKSYYDLPKNISIPPYAKSGVPPKIDDSAKPDVKSPENIAKMRKACHLASKVLKSAGELIKPGITTQKIDDFVFEMTTRNGAYPSPLNYRGFPKSVCTSVNNCACHGIPDSRQLVNGDIINVDITVYLVSILYHILCYFFYFFFKYIYFIYFKPFENEKKIVPCKYIQIVPPPEHL